MQVERPFGLASLEWIGCQQTEMARENVFTKYQVTSAAKSAEGTGAKPPSSSPQPHGWVLVLIDKLQMRD